MGETLRASTDGVGDADGLAGANFKYQWITNDGADDSGGDEAGEATYTLHAA